MPRVTYVKSARKDNPVVKAGEPYYWWKFRHGGKHYSTTRPRPSQLTQSEYLSGIRSLMEQVEDYAVRDPATGNFFDPTDLRDTIVPELETLRETCEESLENMPDSLRDSPTGELLQERIDACESAQNELEGMDLEFNMAGVEQDSPGYADRLIEEQDDWGSCAKDEMHENLGNCDI